MDCHRRTIDSQGLYFAKAGGSEIQACTSHAALENTHIRTTEGSRGEFEIGKKSFGEMLYMKLDVSLGEQGIILCYAKSPE